MYISFLFLDFFALGSQREPHFQRNIGCVGSQRKMLALAMYISCFLCIFHLRLVPNANPISGGIWALEYPLTYGIIEKINEIGLK